MKMHYLHIGSPRVLLHMVLLAGAFALLTSSPRATEATPCISPMWVNNYLATYHNTTNGRYGSPEAPHTATYYNAAQAVDMTSIPAMGTVYAAVDPRLVLAISGAESHFATDQTCCTPYNNDWNWGGGCGSCTHYNDLDTPITAVVTGLTQTYMAALGLVTIEAMSTRYCGSNCGPPPGWCTGANAWICNVKSFYANSLGTPGNLSDLTYFQPDAIGTCCTGDCNNNHAVTIDDILTVINIALMNTDPSACPAATYRDGGFVSILNALDSVNLSLVGCRQWAAAGSRCASSPFQGPST